MLGVVGLLAASAASARTAGDPVRLAWEEGDVAGVTSIRSADGSDVVGFVEYRQSRAGNVLSTHRVARFRDGSSDEDVAEAEVGSELRALRGRSTIRDAHGDLLTDLDIDVTGGHVRGMVRRGDVDQTYDERVDLPPGTYWGPLLFIVLKNFDRNADGGDRVVFRTVAPVPSPRVFDLELVRLDRTELSRAGTMLSVDQYRLRPTLHWAVDPLIRLVVPAVDFFILPGDPPALVRFAGPRNYTGRRIVLE